MFSKKVMVLVITVIALAFTAMPTYATGLPYFPSCPNPGGTMVAGYAEGWHQIAGGDLKEGSDYVYKIGDNKFVQCFCSGDKSHGIQTNWLHEMYLSSRQQQRAINNGWIKITNGLDWGLPAGAYFAQNIPYDCHTCSQEETTVSQTNDTHILNHVDAISDTGANTLLDLVGVGTVNTGESTIDVTITNETSGNTLSIQK